MGFYKNVLAMTLVLSGCALHDQPASKAEQRYRGAVRQEMNQVAPEFQGGNFPYYHWAAPIVQEVRIPAHISQGAMIPEHNELVIIKPGEWILNGAYPIESQQRKTHDDQVTDMDLDVSNITALPNSPS